MKALVKLDIGGRHVEEILTGTDAEELLANAKARVAKELGWKGLFLNAMTPLGFAQKAVQLYNQHNSTHYDLPQNADEFIHLGKDLGYLTLLPEE